MSSEFVNGKVSVSSVLHPYENEFLLSFFGSDFTKRQPPSDIWLGFIATPDRQMIWSDGRGVSIYAFLELFLENFSTPTFSYWSKNIF